MAARRITRWQGLDHSGEPLLSYVLGRDTTVAEGPIAEFLAKKAAEQAPKTHSWYREALMQLWAFLEERGLTRVQDLNEHTVNLFRISLRDRRVTENTISNRLRAIRAFGRWMVQRGWADADQLSGLKVPQSTKPDFDLIPDATRTQLFALYQPNTFLGSRNLAILAVLSDTGLRREEAANLQLKNVDVHAQTLKVYSDKTEEWRYLPLTDEATTLIKNHLTWRDRYFTQTAHARTKVGDDAHRRRRERKIESDHLFLTWDGRPLSPEALAEVFTRASRKLGCRIHPHLFRHDWITRKALDGESPSVVRRWAGHKSYVMTDYYSGWPGRCWAPFSRSVPCSRRSNSPVWPAARKWPRLEPNDRSRPRPRAFCGYFEGFGYFGRRANGRSSEWRPLDTSQSCHRWRRQQRFAPSTCRSIEASRRKGIRPARVAEQPEAAEARLIEALAPLRRPWVRDFLRTGYRRSAVTTRLNFLRALVPFDRFLREETGVGKGQWSLVIRDVVEEFLAEGGRFRLQRAKVFFAWLLSRKHTREAIARSLPNPQRPLRLRLLPDSQVAWLYRSWTEEEGDVAAALVGLLALVHCVRNTEIRLLRLTMCWRRISSALGEGWSS